jgi:ribosome-binding protein aMBF1 (putative translation factor)
LLTFWKIDDRLSLDVGRAIQQARCAKGWKQKDLATVRRLEASLHVHCG